MAADLRSEVLRARTQEQGFADIARRQIVLINDVEEASRLRLSRLIIDREAVDESLVTWLRDSVYNAAMFQEAVLSLAGSGSHMQVGFDGAFGIDVTPRTIRSSHVGKMVSCRCFVVAATCVCNKPVRCVLYCPATKKFHTYENRHDELDFTVPSEDEYGNTLNLQVGLSEYKDYQVLSVQECPELAPAGGLPCPIDVIVERDLVDKYQPGDRLVVIGACTFERSGQRVLPNPIITASNVQRITGFGRQFVYPRERNMILEFGRTPNAIEVLTRSIAPSLSGHSEIKQALLYMLVGGREVVSDCGLRRRGEIHILLIGDSSVGKSQMIRYVRRVAANAVLATGKLATSQGLTVHETRKSGRRCLQAGAMVFADKGVVCIDEFDKLPGNTLDAIGEPMDRGTITFRTPGLSATVNARCSVLAAANSVTKIRYKLQVYGQYEPTKTLSQNLGLSDAFLSRFDLVFLVRDEKGTDADTELANFVMRLQISAETAAYEAVQPDPNRDDCLQQLVISQYAPGQPESKILPHAFVKAYVSYVKRLKPKLSEPAAEFIKKRWVELRELDKDKEQDEKMVTVSAKTLHTMIRIAEAHAKCRLSLTVQETDAAAAYEVLHFACLRKRPKKTTKQQLRKESLRVREADKLKTLVEAGEGLRMMKEQVIGRPKRGVKRTASEPAKPRKAARRTSSAGPTIRGNPHSDDCLAEGRYKAFLKTVRSLFDSANVDHVSEVVFRQKVKTYGFDDSEITAGLTMMSESNFLMIADGIVCLI